MRIFLTGFMAAGKTTVGRELAALLDARFVDLDREIERREGLSVPRLFARDGEEGFRRAERLALERVVAGCEEGERVVVATGGGTMIDPANRRLMAAGGRIVWLAPDFEVLSARLARAAPGERPLFRDLEQARRLLQQRTESYRRADLHLEIGPDEGPAEVASRVVERLTASEPSSTSCDT